MRDDLEVARDRLERARAELKAGRGGARRPPGGALQGRPARRADGGARGRRLRRPARAHRVPRAHLRPGQRDRGPRAACSRRAPRSEEPAGRARGAARRLAAETILRRRDEIAATRDRLASAQGELRVVRDGRRSGRSPRCARGAVALEEDLDALEARAGRGSAALQARRAAPPARSGGHRAADLAGERHLHLALRPALGPPARRHRHRGARPAPDPRGRLGHAWRSRAHRRLRQLHLHPAHAASMSTCYGHQSSIGVLGRPEREPGPGDRRGRATPATPPARTCTSRCGSTASPVDPMGYLLRRAAAVTARVRRRDPGARPRPAHPADLRHLLRPRLPRRGRAVARRLPSSASRSTGPTR